MEMILESDCDTKSLEDEDTSHSGTNTNSDKMTLWTQRAQISHSGQYTSSTVLVVYRFTDSPSRLWWTVVPHITEDSTPVSIFMLYSEMILLLMEENQINYHQWLDTMDEGQSPLPDVTVQEMYLFLAIMCRWCVMRILWKITEQHKNSFIWPFMKILSNMTNSFTHCIPAFLLGGGGGTRRVEPGPDASYDQLWESSMIYMLNMLKITV
jgi:hypothetical protein